MNTKDSITEQEKTVSKDNLRHRPVCHKRIWNVFYLLCSNFPLNKLRTGYYEKNLLQAIRIVNQRSHFVRTNFKKEIALQKNKRGKGQILLEALWLVFFSCAFLAMLSYLYEKGQEEIQLSRIMKHK